MAVITFNTLLDNLQTVNPGSNFTISNIVVSLFISFIIAMFIFFVYKKEYQGVLYSKSFNISLVMLSLITTMIIMTISNNLILSLGMVGALSIVRFRSAIKDPMDIVFMFWAISIGIANGIGFYKLSIIASIFIAIVLMLLSRKISFSQPYLLVVKYKDKSFDQKKIENIIKSKVTSFSIRSINISGEYNEISVEIKPKKGNEYNLVSAVKAIKGVNDVMMVSYNGDIESV
ncbi:MAG: DUF4956 domain-containing protein [Candidatus Aenigmarchaeota archaeon]|nr:DUF4956 domain-containing protein [Candidatus Aenigmarchaeota archaeon]